MRVTRPRFRSATLRGAALAAASVLLLSACGGNAPGVAAKVGSDEITDEQVDEFARVLCSLGGLPGTESGTPTSEARFNSLQILLVTELAEQVGDTEALDKETVTAAQAQMLASSERVPEDVRDTFEDVAARYVEGQFALIELGRDSLEEQGQTGEISEEEAYAEGDRLMREHVEESDVEVDPRFGHLEDGVLTRGGDELSVPVSPLARNAAEEQPTEELVSALPASQKCG